MDISVVIVNYNSASLTDTCITCIEQSDLQGLSCEVIVVDNNSDEPVADKIRSHHPDVRLLLNDTNQGMGRANNAGARLAKGEFLVIANPDIDFGPDTLRMLHKRIATDMNVGVVGPQLLLPDGSIDASFYRFPTLFIPILRRTFLGRIFKKPVDSYLMNDMNSDSSFEPDWLLGACFMIRRDLFLGLGGFDERYFMYFEDVDLCRRIRALGKTILYFPEAKCVHVHQRSSAHKSFGVIPFNKKTMMHLKSWVKYLLKWGFSK